MTCIVGCADDGVTLAGSTDAGLSRCLENADCPDRFECNVATGLCFPLDACGPDDPCPMDNQVCEEGPGGFRICAFERCEGNDECTELTCPPDEVPLCVAGGCVCGTPCQGGCPPGRGCCVPTDSCEPIPEPCATVTCAPGEFLSITTEGAWSAGECARTGETCLCEALPPLPAGDIGLYSALAFDANGGPLAVTAYNRDYGDLMFGTVDEVEREISWAYLDGVPPGPIEPTEITGAIDGPRGGVRTPGPDVGAHTDVTFGAAGRPYVAYVDLDQGALKFGAQTPTGWQLDVIDGDGPGETGLFASLVADDQGRPMVAYLSAREGPDDGQRRTVLRLAVANNADPRPEQWAFVDLETVSLAGESCAVRCNDDEVCPVTGRRCVVPDPPGTCGRCQSDEACVAGSCVAVVPPPVLRGLPRARGLWPSLAVLPDGDALVTYRDEVDRSLRLARVRTGDLTVTDRVTLEGFGGPLNGDDTGLFPSLFVTPGGEIHLAYMNATQQSLRYLLVDTDLTIVLSETVDLGLGDLTNPDGLLLGADAALVVGGPNPSIVAVAYQDATNGDLRYAERRGDDDWAIQILAGDEDPPAGTFGFYTDMVLDDGQRPWVSTYRYFLAAPGGADNGILILRP